MVVIGKIIIIQIRITDITNKGIIKILYFDKIVSNVIVVGRKVILGMIVLYGQKILKARRITPNWSECGYGQKGNASSGCVCDHKRTESEDTRG